MWLLRLLFRRRQEEETFDPNPGEIHTLPVRPYKVIHADLTFYADPECRNAVQGARLLVLRCDDPKQKQNPVECVPTSKRYEPGQVVAWNIDHKKLCGASWYENPDSGRKERAWLQSVEFIGKIVAL